MKGLKGMRKRGQAIIIGLIVMAITTILWSVFVPVLSPFLDNAAANATARGEEGTALLILLFPLLGWFVVVIGFLGINLGREQ